MFMHGVVGFVCPDSLTRAFDLTVESLASVSIDSLQASKISTFSLVWPLFRPHDVRLVLIACLVGLMSSTPPWFLAQRDEDSASERGAGWDASSVTSAGSYYRKFGGPGPREIIIRGQAFVDMMLANPNESGNVAVYITTRYVVVMRVSTIAHAVEDLRYTVESYCRLSSMCSLVDVPFTFA